MGSKIRRPRPWPRQGRRLGPPQVWNFSFLASQGQTHLAANRHPNATSMASYGRPSLPFASPQTDPASSGRSSLPFTRCYFKPIRQLTGAEGHINGFFRASKPAVCQPLNPSGRCPKATSLKHSLGMLHPAANRHPKATHQWLLMGVQACRLPALKRLKTLQTLKNPQNT